MRKLTTSVLLGVVTASSFLVTTGAAQAAGTSKGAGTNAIKRQKSKSMRRTSVNQTAAKLYGRNTLEAALQGQRDGQYRLEVTYGDDRNRTTQVFQVDIRSGQPSLINPFTRLVEAAGYNNIHFYITTYTSFVTGATFRFRPERTYFR